MFASPSKTAPQKRLYMTNPNMTGPIIHDAPITMLKSALSAEGNTGDIKVLSDRPHWVALQVACQLTSAYRVAELLRELLGDLGPETREQIALALRELLLNAVEHGGHLDPEKTVDLSYIRTPRSVVCYIRDPGEGFSFDSLERSAISNDAQQLFRQLELRAQQGMRPGGLGILLAKRVADDLIYSAKGNEVMFIKYL
jgi:anti-sigma regulatory factor (Ser/Thr protein kinase)